MSMSIAGRPRLAAVMLVFLLMAGCAGQGTHLANPFAPTPPPAPPTKPAPAISMAGHWILASPQAGVCGMNFEGKPGATSGAIHPEGGCPGKFFTSRHWALDKGTLVIRDHKDRPLARLTWSEPKVSFVGKAVSGLQVSLAR